MAAEHLNVENVKHAFLVADGSCNPPQGVSHTVFKAVMRKLTGAVCIIGTSSDHGLHGLTATAVCSVSADPPMILIVINRSSRTHPHILLKNAFTVSILSQEQREVAELFASKESKLFDQVSHRQLHDSCPVIEPSLAFLHCSVEGQIDVGTHTIFIGRVIGGSVTQKWPLLYYDATYCCLERCTPVKV